MTRARDVADTQDNIGGAVPPFTDGKNKIINGDFGIWQRGTSFTPASLSNVYCADRFATNRDGTGATVTVSQQTFTPGTAPVAGYEGTFFYRYANTVAGTGGTYLDMARQPIEDVRTFAGQTVTVSAWIKSTVSSPVGFTLQQNFGTGGSSATYTGTTSITPTTSWVRYSFTATIPSISGKTIGTGSALVLQFSGAVNTVQTVDVWGIQLEVGSTATPFQTATGTKQGELAACQRYYQKLAATATATETAVGSGAGFALTTTGVRVSVPFKQTMRVAPSLGSSAISTFFWYAAVGGGAPTSSVTLHNSTVDKADVSFIWTTANLTANSPGWMIHNGATSYLEFSAEL